MVVYTYGVFDLPHYGHLRALKRAKRLGDELIIGVFTDKVAEGFKRKPIMTTDERVKFIKELNLGWVVEQDTLEPTEEFLNENKVGRVAKAEGAGWTKDRQPKWKGIVSILLPYTNGISTSDIIKRIYDNLKQPD
jgi:cytidyltransferase-like protein